MIRDHDLIITPGKQDRLTITPTRVTVKVTKAHEDAADDLYVAGQKIAEHVDFDRSLRGSFDLLKRRIELSTDSRDVSFTFDFDGERLHD